MKPALTPHALLTGTIVALLIVLAFVAGRLTAPAAPAVPAATDAGPSIGAASVIPGPAAGASATLAPPPAPEAATAAATTPAAASAADSAATPADTSAWPRVLLDLFNAARRARGVPALEYDGALAAIAQGQADDCSRRGWCSHYGSDGSTLLLRMQRARYAPFTFYGEIWAWESDPASAFDLWFNEPTGRAPHRDNILSTHFSAVGIGIAPEVQGGWYFIGDFAGQ